MRDFLGKVKVDKKIKPIHFSKRTAPLLVIGENYYVSFGSNNTYPCKLTEIENRGAGCTTAITIEIPSKYKSKGGVPHGLYADEIGLTKEEAVINTVTS